MNRYIEISRAALTTSLASHGFTPTNTNGEVTYERRHERDQRLVITVYTSVANSGVQARACGDDAIRALAHFVWTPRGETAPRRKTLYRAKILRVNSVEGTLERMLEAAREGWKACNQFYAADYQKRRDAVQATGRRA